MRKYPVFQFFQDGLCLRRALGKHRRLRPKPAPALYLHRSRKAIRTDGGRGNIHTRQQQVARIIQPRRHRRRQRRGHNAPCRKRRPARLHRALGYFPYERRQPLSMAHRHRQSLARPPHQPRGRNTRRPSLDRNSQRRHLHPRQKRPPALPLRYGLRPEQQLGARAICRQQRQHMGLARRRPRLRRRPLFCRKPGLLPPRQQHGPALRASGTERPKLGHLLFRRHLIRGQQH